MLPQRTKKSLSQCNSKHRPCKGIHLPLHIVATPAKCSGSPGNVWMRIFCNSSFLGILATPHPSLLLQVARGLTLNEDSQSRLLACHTATYHTSSSHERPYCLPSLALLPLVAFSMPLLALFALLLTSQREAPKIKGNEKTTCLLLFLTHATHVAGSCQGTMVPCRRDE